MTVDVIFFLFLLFLLGAGLIAIGTHLYFYAKEDYVDRLIKKRKGEDYGDWE